MKDKILIPDIGISSENFRDPEYSLLVMSKLIKALRKVIISKMDDQIITLTEKNMSAFVFLLSIVKIANDDQFKMYNTANEKDQLSILKEIKYQCLYIAYDHNKNIPLVLHKLAKILNDNTKDNEEKEPINIGC